MKNLLSVWIALAVLRVSQYVRLLSVFSVTIFTDKINIRGYIMKVFDTTRKYVICYGNERNYENAAKYLLNRP